MIRLQPSELTLTSDDVDDTFRRISQRQALRAQALTSPRRPARLGRPILRRGPQRSIQRAIVNTLAPHPQPQQALYSSVDDDGDHGAVSPKPLSPTRRDSVADASPLSEEAMSTSTVPTFDLPIRIQPNRQNPPSQSSSDQTRGEAIVPSPAPPSDPIASAVTATSAPDTSSTPSPRSGHAVTESSAELRGGGKSRKKGSSGKITHNPPDSPSSPDKADSKKPMEESRPTKYLKGYFKDPLLHPVGINYHFREIDLPVPRTEPRRYGSRYSGHYRSLSSGNAPAFVLPTPRPVAPASTGAQISYQPPGFASPSGTSTTLFGQQGMSVSSINNPTHARPRDISSEESYASAAFSYYGSELPESRHSSSSLSGRAQLGQRQYDGAAVSSQNLSQEPTGGIASNHQLGTASSRSSSYSSPNLALYGHRGISPLPSIPYTRAQSVQTLVQPSTGQLYQAGPSGGYVDAATAAAQDLTSPLSDYSENYERQRRLQSILSRPLYQSPYQSPYQHNIVTAPLHQSSGNRAGNISHRPQPLQTPATSHLQQSLHRPTHQGPQPAATGSHATRATQRSSENHPFYSGSIIDWDTWIDQPQEAGREAQGSGRGTRVQREAAMRQMQAAELQMIQLSGRARETATSNTSRGRRRHLPRDVSNRPRASQQEARNRRQSPTTETQSPQRPPHENRQTGRGDTATRGRQHRLSPSAAPYVPLRQGIRLHGVVQQTSNQPHSESSSSRNPSTSNTTTASNPSWYIHSPRNPSTTTSAPTSNNPSSTAPLTSLALDPAHGTTSRQHQHQHRAGSPATTTAAAARTHRRVPVDQMNQENSVEVERARMRSEEAAINARYGEEGQQEVMDETPPRIGRVERRMME